LKFGLCGGVGDLKTFAFVLIGCNYRIGSQRKYGSSISLDVFGDLRAAPGLYWLVVD
jgi:hypothetical protein